MRYRAERAPLRVLACAAVAAALVGGLLSGALARVFGSNDPPPITIGRPVGGPAVAGLGGGLQQFGGVPDLRVGTAVQPSGLTDNAQYRAFLAQEFSSLTSESQFKWDVVEPVRGQFDWSAADALVAFAEANHQTLRGHTLVWHNALPGWLRNGSFTPRQLRDLLREHIQAVVGRYRGRVSAWDVVNEPLVDTGGRLRPSLWMDAIGPGYIADALRWAHEADPGAKLYVNDFGVENLNTKSDALYGVVAGLRKAGVPIDGVGIQAHLSVTTRLPTLEANLRRFANLGLDVAVTELDVRLPRPATAAQQLTQAALYAQVLRSCLRVQRCNSLTVWGFTDRYSWIPSAFPGWGEACLFDASFHPKPAYGQLRQVLSAAPRR
jgi:endo-1,4-beta-xylanase